jgi:hypothetical protein
MSKVSVAVSEAERGSEGLNDGLALNGAFRKDWRL